jgi:hypothetical protein
MLSEGDNIRDHFNGVFCNSAPNISGSADFGPDRRDLHSIQLPAAFATETLESVVFVSYDQFELGTPFLAGLTIDPAPLKPRLSHRASCLPASPRSRSLSNVAYSDGLRVCHGVACS